MNDKDKSEIIEKISDAELEVLKNIWSYGTPTTSAQLRSVLGGEDGWDSSTIRTLLRRLVEKGVLTQEKKDVYYYSPTITEAEVMKEKTKTFLHKVYGGNAKGLIAAMLSPDFLTSDDMEEVKNFWKKGRSKHE